MGTPHISFEGIWSAVYTKVGTPHKIGAARLRSRVGGGLVKCDFRSHSGSHQSSAWIQNPSSSRVWKKVQGKMKEGKGSRIIVAKAFRSEIKKRLEFDTED